MEEKTLKQYVQISKAAKSLSVSKDFIHQLIADGHLDGVRLGQRAIRISQDSIDRLLEKSKINPESYYE